jgi:glutaredoxin
MKKTSFVYLPILFFLYIAIETVLKLFGSTLCHSDGCALADSLLNFDSIYLNFIGLLDALIIVLVGWLSYKKRIDEVFFYLVLFASLAFESIMIGYQFFVSPEMCKFCLGVYSFLILMTLLSAYKRLIIVIPVVVSIWVSMSFLAMPKTEAFVIKDGNYLIQSPTCSHCKKVKTYLKKNNIEFTKLAIEDVEARNFATFLNFKSIPILIVKEGKSIQIINGDSRIIDFFSKPEVPVVEDAVVVEDSVAVESSSSSDLLYEEESGADEGCGFASISKLEEESNCSK